MRIKLVWAEIFVKKYFDVTYREFYQFIRKSEKSDNSQIYGVINSHVKVTFDSKGFPI
jgi:hypothetical protein